MTTKLKDRVFIKDGIPGRNFSFQNIKKVFPNEIFYQKLKDASGREFYCQTDVNSQFTRFDRIEFINLTFNIVLEWKPTRCIY